MIISRNGNGKWEILGDDKPSPNYSESYNFIFRPLSNNKGPIGYSFFCPGCMMRDKRIVIHRFELFQSTQDNGNGPLWSCNDRNENPVTPENYRNVDLNWLVFSPSLHYPQSPVCHSIVVGNVINYCNDCEHPLSGQQGVKLLTYNQLLVQQLIN